MIHKTLVLLVFVASAFVGSPLIAADPPAAKRGTPVGVGDIAPDFTLDDRDGRKHTLSAERGKRPVVLVFYRGHW